MRATSGWSYATTVNKVEIHTCTVRSTRRKGAIKSTKGIAELGEPGCRGEIVLDMSKAS